MQDWPDSSMTYELHGDSLFVYIVHIYIYMMLRKLMVSMFLGK